MRIRIVFGVFLSLAAAFAFVWLQFRAEAIAQDVSPKDQPADSISPFGSNQVSSDSEAGFPALADPATADAVFAEDPSVGKEEPATSDAFADDTPPARSSKRPLPPDVEPVDSESYDPFSSAGAALPSEPFDAIDAFSSDSESGSDEFGTPMKDQPLRIIRLRTVRAIEVRSIFVDIFHDEHVKPRWFLSTEAQSNSLIFKGSASYFGQLKKLASELDRLAEIPFDPRKKTQSWPIPHVFDSSNDTSTDVEQWPIQILRLRHLKAADFAGIAWDLAKSQNSKPKLRITFEHTTNSVVLRGPAAEISQVEQLAQQLDQPAAARREPSDPSFDFQAQSDMREVFDFNRDAPLEIIEEPAVQSQRMREHIAASDRESVRLASEIRSLRRNYSSDHPKVAEARQKLEDVLKVSFQLRLQLQSLEVAVIKSRLADIESRVHQRSRLRQQIINRRLHELLGEKDDLSWEVARTGPVQPNSSLDELPSFPTPEKSMPLDEAAFPPDRKIADDLVPPTPYAGEIPSIEPETLDDPRGTYESDKSLTPVNELDILSDPIEGEPTDIAESVAPESDGYVAAFPEGFTHPTPGQGTIGQKELIVAENAVEISKLKVERIQSRLNKAKDASQVEELDYEMRLAMLALDQARKLLDQKHRWIEVQRNSLKINIRLLEKNLEVMETEYKLILDANKKVPGSVSESEVRRHALEVGKAELSLQQAVADLKVFEVKNRSSRKPESAWSRRQNQPVKKNRLVPEPDSSLEIIEGDNGENPTDSPLAEPISDDRDVSQFEFDSSESLPELGESILEATSP